MPDRNSYDTMELYFGCTCKITVHGTCTAKIIADRQNTITREVERTNSRYSTLHPPPGPRARRDATLGSRGVRWAAGAGPRKAAPRYIFGRSQTRCTLGGATPRGDLGSVYHSFSLGETLRMNTTLQLKSSYPGVSRFKTLYGGLHSIPKQFSGVGLGPYKHEK